MDREVELSFISPASPPYKAYRKGEFSRVRESKRAFPLQPSLQDHCRREYRLLRHKVPPLLDRY